MRLALPGVVVVLCAIFAPRASAVTNVFLPVADTSLLEVSPTNNLGGYPGMNSGTTQEGMRTRALMRFDLSGLPTNTVILAAKLQLEVTRDPDETPVNSSFGLHRMLRAWGEGDKSPNGQQAGKGLPASPGEATWDCAFHPTNTWNLPGGEPDADFSSSQSSFQGIVGRGTYDFPDAPGLRDDITAWVNQPPSNFGWLLLCTEESSNLTARRFATREDVSYPPRLELQYLIPPRIDQIQKVDSQFNLSFLAQPGQTYVVQHRPMLNSGAWQTLASAGPFTQQVFVLVVDLSTAPQHFYRLNTY